MSGFFNQIQNLQQNSLHSISVLYVYIINPLNFTFKCLNFLTQISIPAPVNIRVAPQVSVEVHDYPL